jgi:hypothetical protein
MDFRCLSIGNRDANQANHLKKRGKGPKLFRDKRA